MSLSDEILRDFQKLLNERGVTFNWNGSDYLGLMSRIRVEQEFMVGGMVESPESTLRVPTSAFVGAQPDFGQRLTINGDEYRIFRVRKHPASPLLTLEIGPVDE